MGVPPFIESIPQPGLIPMINHCRACSTVVLPWISPHEIHWNPESHEIPIRFLMEIRILHLLLVKSPDLSRAVDFWWSNPKKLRKKLAPLITAVGFGGRHWSPETPVRCLRPLWGVGAQKIEKGDKTWHDHVRFHWGSSSGIHIDSLIHVLIHGES
jgi:hypothetical protein